MNDTDDIAVKNPVPTFTANSKRFPTRVLAALAIVSEVAETPRRMDVQPTLHAPKSPVESHPLHPEQKMFMNYPRHHFMSRLIPVRIVVPPEKVPPLLKHSL